MNGGKHLSRMDEVEGVQTTESLKDAPPRNRERCILSIGSTFAIKIAPFGVLFLWQKDGRDKLGKSLVKFQRNRIYF